LTKHRGIGSFVDCKFKSELIKFKIKPVKFLAGMLFPRAGHPLTHHPPLEIDFQGRVIPPPTPENLEIDFQGRVRGDPPLEMVFQGPACYPPANSIFSYEKQEQVPYPSLNICFFPPLISIFHSSENVLDLY